jgi:hypothetical protein
MVGRGCQRRDELWCGITLERLRTSDGKLSE